MARNLSTRIDALMNEIFGWLRRGTDKAKTRAGSGGATADGTVVAGRFVLKPDPDYVRELVFPAKSDMWASSANFNTSTHAKA